LRDSLRVAAGVALAPYSTLGIGGDARYFVRADRPEDVVAADAWSRERDLPLLVLGGGSNMVVADEGWPGLVLQIAIAGVAYAARVGETIVRAGAGGNWDDLVVGLVARGLTGVECLSGIPGSVGGTPVQNVGAYGQEVAGAIEEVAAYDRRLRELVVLPAAACGFGYRTSRFKQEDAGRFIICEVTFRLRPGEPTTTYPDIRTQLGREGLSAPGPADVRRVVIEVRRRKGMVLDPADPDTRSVGSFFVNPVTTEEVRARIAALAGRDVPGFSLEGGRVKIPAAWLIEASGFDRGHAEGGAAMSSKHPLALVNRGGATARDVLRLAAGIKRRVHDRFGISLRPEPVFVGCAPGPDLEYLQR
jgi:UDP-N-acetylmuramate dehydrogenase